MITIYVQTMVGILNNIDKSSLNIFYQVDAFG